MFKQRRHYNKSASRRKVQAVGGQFNRPRRTPIEITSATSNMITPNNVSVVFNQVVYYTGTLPGWTVLLKTVTAVIRISPTTFTLSFSGAIVATDLINIPFEDPAFRNAAGGYVHPSVVEAA